MELQIDAHANSESASASHAAAASCPRCGYDLAGAVASWEDKCPVKGVCSECGLEFDWPEVMNRGRLPPRWSIEHATIRGPTSLAIAALRAAGISLAPARLWRTLKMEHPIIARRLWMLLISTCLVLHLAMVAASYRQIAYYMPLSSYFDADVKGSPYGIREALPILLFPYKAPGAFSDEIFHPGLMWIMLMSASVSAAPLLLWQTRKRASVRYGHLGRHAVYGFVPVGVMVVLVIALNAGVLHPLLKAGVGATPPSAFWRAAWKAGAIAESLAGKRQWIPIAASALWLWISTSLWSVRYLRLRRGVLAATLLTATGVLAMALVMLLTLDSRTFFSIVGQ